MSRAAALVSTINVESIAKRPGIESMLFGFSSAVASILPFSSPRANKKIDLANLITRRAIVKWSGGGLEPTIETTDLEYSC